MEGAVVQGWLRCQDDLGSWAEKGVAGCAASSTFVVKHFWILMGPSATYFHVKLIQVMEVLAAHL